MISWNIVIKNLMESGLTLKEISGKTGFSIQELVMLLEEKTDYNLIPPLKLLDLHMDVCPDKHRDVCEPFDF